MKDLNYFGEEPEWEKNDLLDRVAGSGQVSDEKTLKQVYEKLQKEKRELASELQRTQDLLKQQVDIDKENNDLILIEIKQLKSQIARDKQMRDQYAALQQTRNDQIEEMKKQLPKDQLTADNLARLGVK